MAELEYEVIHRSLSGMESEEARTKLANADWERGVVAKVLRGKAQSMDCPICNYFHVEFCERVQGRPTEDQLRCSGKEEDKSHVYTLVGFMWIFRGTSETAAQGYEGIRTQPASRRRGVLGKQKTRLG